MKKPHARESWAHLRPKIARMAGAGRAQAEIARAIGRDAKKLSAEMSRMRADGLLPRASNSPIRFTPRMDERLRSAIEGGMSYKDYAAKSGISSDVIRHRADKLGVRSRNIVEIDWPAIKPVIVEMRAAGASSRKIAKATGVSECSVRRVIATMDLPPQRPPAKPAPFWTETRLQVIVDMVRQHQTLATIAGVIGEGATSRTLSGLIPKLKRQGRISPFDIRKCCIKRKREQERARAPRAKAPRVANVATVKSAPKPKTLAAPAAARAPLPSFTLLAAERDPVDLMDLTPGMCRWPYGKEAPFKFCGCRISLGSYCPAHAAVAHPSGKVAKAKAWMKTDSWGRAPSYQGARRV